MKLFVDENLPPALARALDAIFKPEHLVQHVIDKFGRRGLLDEEWIPALGAEGGWVVLSGDITIAKKKPSRALFLRSNLVGFFPVETVMKMPLHRQAARVLTAWEDMCEVASRTTRGCYELTQRGSKFAQIGS